MSCALQLVDVDRTSFARLPCCGVKSQVHAGRREKQCWLEANEQFGVRAKVLVAPDGRQIGYLEYVPGEYAWRGVDARGYLFIHCLWMHSKKHQRQGCARFMIEAAVEDARKSGTHGVAAMAREGPWMADRRVFVANGFEPVDSAPPDYELLVRKLDGTATNPAFLEDWDRKAAEYGNGLTIIRSSQCPHIQKFASEIAEAARQEYHLRPRIVELQSCTDAQRAPTPYAVFCILYKGRVVADHQISRTRFRNIMNKLA